MKTECCGNPLRGCTDCPPAAPAAEPYAFVQHVKGYAPRLFLASEVGLDFPDQEWAPGVSVEPLYRGATPAPAQSREPLTLTDEQIRTLAVRSKTLPEFACAVIAEFCKINGIGSQP